VADRQSVRKSIKQLQRVKTWQLLILLVLLCFIAATFLRLNNTGMIARRNAVADADKSANTNEISARIYDLQRYSAAHMNADTGVFYLQEQYNRDVKRQAEESGGTGSAKALEIRKAADAVCKPQFYGWSPQYVRCYVNELNKYGANEISESELTLPNSALYRYSFVSPVWSPDFAGWSIVGACAILIIIIARLVSLGILRLLLRRHYREL
jgi:hypothetical protein